MFHTFYYKNVFVLITTNIGDIRRLCKDGEITGQVRNGGGSQIKMYWTPVQRHTDTQLKNKRNHAPSWSPSSIAFIYD